MQLSEILQARLVEANSIQGNAFNRGAINMAAAKVASSSGDMRMCLKYCRRAIEVCVEVPCLLPGAADDVFSGRSLALVLWRKRKWGSVRGCSVPLFSACFD